MKALLDNRISANATAMVIGGGLANSISNAARAGKLGRIRSAAKPDEPPPPRAPLQTDNDKVRSNSQNTQAGTISSDAVRAGYAYTPASGSHIGPQGEDG